MDDVFCASIGGEFLFSIVVVVCGVVNTLTSSSLFSLQQQQPCSCTEEGMLWVGMYQAFLLGGHTMVDQFVLHRREILKVDTTKSHKCKI